MSSSIDNFGFGCSLGSSNACICCWQQQHCTAVEIASSSTHDLRFDCNLAKATTALFLCSKERLQRSLGVGSDSFSDSASQGASASSSSVLQHQVVSRQQQHLHFSFFSFDSSSIQHRTYVSVSVSNISTASFSSSSISTARPATQHQ